MIRVFITILLYLISLFTQAQQANRPQTQDEQQFPLLINSAKEQGNSVKGATELVLSEKDLTFE